MPTFGWHYVRLAFCPVGILSYHRSGYEHVKRKMHPWWTQWYFVSNEPISKVEGSGYEMWRYFTAKYEMCRYFSNKYEMCEYL